MRSLHARLAALVSIAALAACAAPALAGAAGEPQITSADFDAEDRIAVAWQLAPDTTFDFIEISSVSIPDPEVPEFFADDNFADFECAPPPKICEGTRTQTSYRSLRQARDRRYFVRVIALGAGDLTLSSPIWVVDETKPLIPGEQEAATTPTNTPALGRLFTPPAPETIPEPTLTLPSPPRRIETVLSRGIRARLTCPVAECLVKLRLRLGDTPLRTRQETLAPDRRQTFVLRPLAFTRRQLRRRDRLQLEIRADVIQPGAKKTRIARSITVRR